MQLLIDKEDVHKVLRSMMKIMEDIFTGTMNRFMGSGGLAPHAEVNQSIEKGIMFTMDSQINKNFSFFKITTFNIVIVLHV